MRPSEAPEGPMPVVVFIHGGGWRGGRRQGGVRRLFPFAKRGYFCASIEYRLSGEATFPAQIEDCKCAIRFLRAHAGEYGIDPDRIGVWGTSAGGHLSALLGTSGGVEEFEGEGGWAGESSQVQAACPWSGPSELWSLLISGPKQTDARGRTRGNPVAQLIGQPDMGADAMAELASPVTHVDADDPPFLIIHGELDKTVPVNQSKLLHRLLEETGAPTELLIVEGAGHGVAASEGGRAAVERMEKFFDLHLKGADAPTPKKVPPPSDKPKKKKRRAQP